MPLSEGSVRSLRRERRVSPEEPQSAGEEEEGDQPELRGNEPEHYALVKLTSKREVTANKMQRSIQRFVEVRAEPRSLHVALASAQSLIKMVRA